VDDDLREALKEVGKHIEDVSRQISSTKSNPASIRAMRKCLLDAADTLSIYLRIQGTRLAD
jgi:hypothetical protein